LVIILILKKGLFRIILNKTYDFSHKKMEYEKLLEKAKKELPKTISNIERFEIPKVMGHIQGNTTVISNFMQIAKTLNRDPNHLLKYILRELAAPGKLSGQRLIIGKKVSAKTINKKIRQYAMNYVICPDCGKPDTQIIKEKNAYYLKCAACGSKHRIRMI